MTLPQNAGDSNDSPNGTSLSTTLKEELEMEAKDTHSGRSIVFETGLNGFVGHHDDDVKPTKRPSLSKHHQAMESKIDVDEFRRIHRQGLKDNRTTFNRFRLFTGKLVNNEYVQLSMIGLIIINATFMGVATFPFIRDIPHRAEIFQKIDTGFLTIFTIELAMQFIYFGVKLLQDPWLVFDLVVIVLSWSLDGLQIVRSFRIFRAVRIVTRIKVLRDLIAAIGQVIPRMAAIMGFLCLIFYIFAVLFTELYKDLELSANYFRTLDASLFTLYEMMTLEWAGVAREVMDQRRWAFIPFLAYIGITGFIVFNLIIAVICNAVSIVDKLAREREAIARGENVDTPEEKIEYCQEQVELLSDQVTQMMRNHLEIQETLDMIVAAISRDRLDESVHSSSSQKSRRNKRSSSRSTSPGPDRGISPLMGGGAPGDVR